MPGRREMKMVMEERRLRSPNSRYRSDRFQNWSSSEGLCLAFRGDRGKAGYEQYAIRKEPRRIDG